MEVGIIGTGEMGNLYAREFDNLGYKVNCCDLPENRDQLEKNLDGTKIRVLDGGVAVSRRSDLIFYLMLYNITSFDSNTNHVTHNVRITPPNAKVDKSTKRV